MQNQSQSQSKFQSTLASVNTALAPIHKQIQPLPVRTLGVQRFINMRDLMFVIDSQDKPFMAEYKQYVDNLKIKFYATGFIIPLSLLVNLKLQRRFPNSFGGKRFYNFFIDMLWFTGTTYLMILANEQLPRQTKFQQIKDNLLTQQNPDYLLHMLENYSRYKVPFNTQIGSQRPYNKGQIQNMLYKARTLEKDKKKNSKNPSASEVV